MSRGHQSGPVASVMSLRTGLAGWLRDSFKTALVAGDPAAAWAARVRLVAAPRPHGAGQSQGEFTAVGGTSGCRSPTSGE